MLEAGITDLGQRNSEGFCQGRGYGTKRRNQRTKSPFKEFIERFRQRRMKSPKINYQHAGKGYPRLGRKVQSRRGQNQICRGAKDNTNSMSKQWSEAEQIIKTPKERGTVKD